MSVRGDDDGTRWAAQPALARGIRVAVFLTPVAAAVSVSSLAHLALGAAGSRVEQIWHLAVLLAVSTVALVIVDTVARRALPLATLLELSMLFPDRAPSRLAVAREAIRKRPVEAQLARVRDAGADPAVAAREILGLVAAMRAHDRPTRGHAERVRMLTDLIADAMHVPERDRDLLRWAAILHDIGKLRVAPAILNKTGKPTTDEWATLRAHPSHGAQIAHALLPWLGEWGDVIIQHHERYDGTGYPAGLAGRDISLGGRIVAVADAYEVMTATRSYRRPVSRVAAHRELVKWSGQQFDPAVVRAMVGLSAPRLRRAQGVLAWLSDVPMVASSYVPAATVARVVGVGALATGAATGVGLPTAVVSANPAPAHFDRASVSSTGSTKARSVDSSAVGAAAAVGTSNQADHANDLGAIAPPDIVASTEASTQPTPAVQAASGQTAADAQPDTSTDDEPKADNSKADTESGNSGSSSSGSSNSGSSNSRSSNSRSSNSRSSNSGSSNSGSSNSGSSNSGSSNSGSSNSGSGTSGSGNSTVGTLTPTVDKTVGSTGKAAKGTVGAVTDTVEGTVGVVTEPLAASGGTVGTVTGTVGSTVAAVTDTATGTVTSPVTSTVGTLGGVPGKRKK